MFKSTLVNGEAKEVEAIKANEGYFLKDLETGKILSTGWLINSRIELIEDNKIDIDNIQEYNEYFIEQSNTTEDVKSLARKINELVQAVKQLNKEVQELKSK